MSMATQSAWTSLAQKMMVFCAGPPLSSRCWKRSRHIAMRRSGMERTPSKALISAGVPRESVFYHRRLTFLPGYFRATTMWDLLLVTGGELQAVVELKAQMGPSFENNANNRAEEALGNAVDLWTAYREGAYRANLAWVGYLFVLEDCEKTRRPLRTDEPHFPVLADFRGTSYAERYELRFAAWLPNDTTQQHASCCPSPTGRGWRRTTPSLHPT